jgi:predicted aspartyl protease
MVRGLIYVVRVIPMSKLGHAFVEAIVYSGDLSASRKVRLLVDTGSTYTWISRKRLAELSITPRRERGFRTVDHRILKRKIGEAIIDYQGERVTTIVVFAEDEDEEVLGVYTLEGLAMEFDPVANELRKVDAILAV